MKKSFPSSKLYSPIRPFIQSANFCLLSSFCHSSRALTALTSSSLMVALVMLISSFIQLLARLIDAWNAIPSTKIKILSFSSGIILASTLSMLFAVPFSRSVMFFTSLSVHSYAFHCVCEHNISLIFSSSNTFSAFFLFPVC